MLDGMESVQYWCHIPRQVNVQGENVVGRNWIRWKGKCWFKEDDERRSREEGACLGASAAHMEHNGQTRVISPSSTIVLLRARADQAHLRSQDVANTKTHTCLPVPYLHQYIHP